jgi:DNA (cytosine-5)-methyltransferase 1
MVKHKLLDLFSGIGGFSLAADKFGIETIAFVEKEPFCQKVLKKHWNDVPIIDDIRKIKGEDYDSATIVSGGFPCQPFSVAGKRKGQDDDRYLWDETIRVVAECKPRWFIGENVDGLVNIQDGMVLRQVQDDLEKEGFQVQCIVIPASGVGAWHQRKRVWIIGHNVSHTNSGELHGCMSTSRLCGEKLKGLDSNEEKDRNEVRSETERCGEQVTDRGNVSDSDKQRTQIQIEGKQPSIKVSGSTEQKSWWQTQSELCGVPNGVSYELHSDRTNRIKTLGNSIVPQIVEQLFKSIIYAEQ